MLRAIELECDYVVKCTNVDGLYDKDPNKHDDAKKISRVNYQEILEKNLRIMNMIL